MSLTQTGVDSPVAAAQRVAALPVTDRLEGLIGEEAKHAATHLMASTGLSYREACAVVSAIYWQGWKQGWAAARSTHETKEN